MGDTEDVEEYTYLVRTRSGRDEYAVATIRKYHEGLLIDVEKDPTGRANCLIITSAIEIPIEALDRIGGA